MAVPPSTPFSKLSLALEPCADPAAPIVSVSPVGAADGVGREALLTLARALARQAAAEVWARTMEPELSEQSP